MAQSKEFNARRDAVFNDLNIETATRWWLQCGGPPPVTPLVPLANMHKARLQWLDATDAMLAESVKWLTDNGFEATYQGAPPLTPERRDADRKILDKEPLGYG